VGELQKSGVYHAVFADSMRSAWRSMVGISCNLCNGASTAVDRQHARVFGAVAPGNLVALSARHGQPAWFTPFGDVLHYEGVSEANGVVYSIETSGFLDAVDAGTGAPLLHRFLPADGAEFFTFGSAGPAIARDTVYVPVGSRLIAYRVH
jgi:outer membrane protein assembly factor BamB